MTPEISVLIPVYNAEKYLPQCLRSLQEQTFSDFEIICIDDGSTDKSRQIIQNAALADPRICLICQTNQGVAFTRNRLIKQARGTYIAFVDADDFVLPEYLEKLYKTAKESAAEIVKCFFYETEEDGSLRSKAHCTKGFYRVPAKKDASRFRAGYEDSVLWGKLFQRLWLEKNQFEFWPGRVAEDFPFVVLTFLFADKIAVVAERVYCYRKGLSQAITSGSWNLTVGVLLNLLSLREDLLCRNRWNRQTASEWLRAAVWSYCRLRKFSIQQRQQQQELTRRVWQQMKQTVRYCSFLPQLRWRLFFLLVSVCGPKSRFFWGKIFR